jgi:hypothetical protein
VKRPPRIDRDKLRSAIAEIGHAFDNDRSICRAKAVHEAVDRALALLDVSPTSGRKSRGGA